MHEMSIALSIVEIAEKEAKKASVNEFAAIELEIGTLAGIEFSALEFVWEAAAKGSVLENAKRNITKIQAIARCIHCKTEFPVKFVHDPCPECESFEKEIICGKELRVKSLETF
jgi:hydrogenase nickel incorporation protein HypA/HybF